MSAVDDARILKMAEAEILGEAKRAAARHSLIGISGWRPCPKPNKLFLTNALLQTISSNRLLLKKKEAKNIGSNKKKKERKLSQKHTNFVFKKPEKKSSAITNKETKTSNNKSESVTKKKKDKEFKCARNDIKSVKRTSQKK